MTINFPVLSSLDDRLAAARGLISSWLSDQLQASADGVLRLLCEANGVDPGGDPPGEALARDAVGGQTAVTALLADLNPANGADDLAPVFMAGEPLASAQLVGEAVDLDSLLPGLTAAGYSLVGADRLFEDRFSGFTAGWSLLNGEGQLFINRGWAEHATVVELAEMLAEQLGHQLQERLQLAEPAGDEGKIFAEGLVRLATGLSQPGDAQIVPAGTVEALRLRNDTGFLYLGTDAAAPALALELGELSDQFFERLALGVGYGEVPMLDLRGSTNEWVRATFGDDESDPARYGLLGQVITELDSFASAINAPLPSYATGVDAEVQLGAEAQPTTLLSLDPGDPIHLKHAFGLNLGEENTEVITQPLWLSAALNEQSALQLLSDGAPLTGERVGLIAVPWIEQATPEQISGFRLFAEADAAAAYALFDALTQAEVNWTDVNHLADGAGLTLQPSAQAGASEPVSFSLDLSRLYAGLGWEASTIGEHLQLEHVFGATAFDGESAAAGSWGETSASGFMASFAVLTGTGGQTPVLPASPDWSEAFIRPQLDYPILSFQGTDNLAGKIDDANPAGVGIVQYLTNVGQVLDEVVSWSLPHLHDGSSVPLSLTGHSLGASLAQQFALTFLDPEATGVAIVDNLIQPFGAVVGDGVVAAIQGAKDLLAEAIGDPNSNGFSWKNVLAGTLNTAIILNLAGVFDESEAEESESSSPNPFELLADDFSSSLDGYLSGLASLRVNDALGLNVVETGGLPLYRTVTFAPPGVQDWQLDVALDGNGWDVQPSADVSHNVTIGDVIPLAGDGYMPGELKLTSFDVYPDSPESPTVLDLLIGGVANFHGGHSYSPARITSFESLAERAGGQFIYIADSQLPLSLIDLPDPADDIEVLHRYGVIDSDPSTIELPGFGTSSGAYDATGDINWLLHRQQILHVVGMVDGFISLLKNLMGTPPEATITTHTASLDLGAFDPDAGLLRIEHQGLRDFIGAGKELQFNPAAGTELPDLVVGSATPRGWDEDSSFNLYLKPVNAGSSDFEIYALTPSGEQGERLQMLSEEITINYFQDTFDQAGFGSGKYQLSPADEQAILAEVNRLFDEDYELKSVSILASTDPEPLSSNLQGQLSAADYLANNAGLAAARAMAVRDYLREIIPDRAAAYGQTISLAELDALIPPLTKRPYANEAEERTYVDPTGTYTLQWEMGDEPRDSSARFVSVDLSGPPRLQGEGSIATTWEISESGTDLSLNWTQLLCDFTASYGSSDVQVLMNILFGDGDFFTKELLGPGLLFWGLDNLQEEFGQEGTLSNLLGRIPELTPMLEKATASREQAEKLRSDAVSDIAGQVLDALSDPEVSLLPLWLSPEEGLGFDSIGQGIETAAIAVAVTPGAISDLVDLWNRTDQTGSWCDLLCAFDLLDDVPQLLGDPAARSFASELLTGNQELMQWFMQLDHAPANHILRLDGDAWEILAGTEEEVGFTSMQQWNDLASLKPAVWTAMRQIEFNDYQYRREILEALRDGEQEHFNNLTGWSNQPLTCLIAAAAILADSAVGLISEGLSGDGSLAQFLGESERSALAASITEPLREFQLQLTAWESGDRDSWRGLLPSQLVDYLQELLNSTINDPLDLDGEHRVTITGNLPTLEQIRDGVPSGVHWLELDFSGIELISDVSLPLDALLSSALGFNVPGLADLPELDLEFSAGVNGGFRFGLDFSESSPEQMVLIDTEGLQGVGTPDLAVQFSAAAGAELDLQLPQWLDGVIEADDLARLVTLDGQASLDFHALLQDPSLPSGLLALGSLADGLGISTEASLELNLNADLEGLDGLVSNFAEAVQAQLEQLAAEFSIDDCAASWLNFVDQVISLVGNLADGAEQIPALPTWVPSEARAGLESFSAGLRDVADGLAGFRDQVLDADAFVGLINGLFR
ncbi:MAG: hypothetical protein VKJ31_05350, partial [Synechococcus sp.]|nr:hypothetical protein [Synechococcus sp.]